MELSIRQLIEAIGTSVSDAQQTIEYHSMERFFDFFQPSQPNMAVNSINGINLDENGGDTLEPKTVKIALPCQDDITKTEAADVPLAALTQHRQVHLDKVTVKIKTRLQSDDNSNIMADMTAPIPNNGSSPDNSESSDVLSEINLEFNVDERSEGLSRVVQNMTKTL